MIDIGDPIAPAFDLVPSVTPVPGRITHLAETGDVDPLYGYVAWTWDGTNLIDGEGHAWAPLTPERVLFPPESTNNVGTHAWRSIHATPPLTAGAVVGRVSLWGRIVMHDHGYRAECAYPYALQVREEDDIARAVRRRYIVDVETV